MRAYKFLKACYGLEALSKKRLKQSRVNELNDPFELRPYDVSDPKFRNAFLATRDQMHREIGLLCFGAKWDNPLLWAHYGDCQRGLCLGFDIPDPGASVDGEVMRIHYQETPLPIPTDFNPDEEQPEFARKALSTKFKDWGYEEEIRIWGPLRNEEHGFYFVKFGENLRLCEVVIGARSTLARRAIEEVLGPDAGEVRIAKAREDHSSFRMVENDNF
jgi:Protein of unknown function (DUF2971)